jgi:hypothetical protein
MGVGCGAACDRGAPHDESNEGSEHMSTLVKASVTFFIAAEVFVFAALGVGSLPVVGSWALAGIAIGSLWWLSRRPLARTLLGAAFVAGCLVFVGEEGLFFLPSAGALLGAAVIGRHTGHALHAGGPR